MGETGAAIADPLRVAAVRRTRLLAGERDEGCDRTVRFAARLLAAPIALVTLLDDQREHVVSAVGSGRPLPLREVPLAHAFARRAVETGGPVEVPDTLVDRREHDPAVESLGIASWMAVPLHLGPVGALGVLCVADTTPRQWTPAEREILEELGALLVVGLERRVAWLGVRDRGVLFAQVVEQLGDAVVIVDSDGSPVLFNGRAERALLRPDDDRAPGAPRMFRGGDRAPVGEGDFPLDRAVRAGAAVEERVRVTDGGDDEGRWHRVVAAPVWDTDGTPLGAFCVLSELCGAGDASATAGIPGGPRIERDASVVMGTRAGFATVALERMAGCRDTGEGLLLYLVRVDALDRIERRFGGLQGSATVQEVGEVVLRSFPPGSVVGRVGPDSLAVLARDAGHGEAARALGRVQLGVAELNSAGPRPFVVSVHIGVAAWDPGLALTLDQLLLRADSSARERGRALEATA